MSRSRMSAKRVALRSLDASSLVLSQAARWLALPPAVETPPGIAHTLSPCAHAHRTSHTATWRATAPSADRLLRGFLHRSAYNGGFPAE
jgi:hypothetical protein